MTDRAAMKMALDALSWIANVNAMDYEYQRKAREPIEALRQALALDKKADNARELKLDYEPEQAPVNWLTLQPEAQAIVEGKYLFKRFIDGTPLANDIAVWMTEFALKYATPHSAKGSADSAEGFGKRKWQGLTDDEIKKIMQRWRGGYIDIKDVEQLLKEKNDTI